MITGGEAHFDNGGGIRNRGTLNIFNSSIAENLASQELGGGGIFNDGGKIVITESTIYRNTASISGGGGIYNKSESGAVTIRGSTIRGNFASVRLGGGGIFNGSGTMNITNSAIHGNVGERSGGGIKNGSGELNITNSTIRGNFTQALVGDTGGGIDNGDGCGIITIASSTIATNGAVEGGGISNACGTVALQNTILAENQSSSSPDCRGNITLIGNNLIGATLGCDLRIGSSDIIGEKKLEFRSLQTRGSAGYG
jgi:hypothetical protein